jgi:hypothetical protein
MLDSSRIFSGLINVLEVFMNPSLLPYNEIERSLGSVVFIGLLMFFIGSCVATLSPVTGKTAAVSFGVLMGLSVAAMRGGVEVVVIIMGMTGAVMKLVGGIALASYCIFVPIAGVVMVLLTAVFYYLFLMSFDLETLALFKVAILVFSGIATYRQLLDLRGFPIGTPQVCVGLALLITISGLVDFGKLQVLFRESGLLFIIFGFFIGYSFLLGLGVGVLGGIAARMRRY